MPPGTHQGFDFAVTWNSLSVFSFFYFSEETLCWGSQVGRYHTAFCFDLKINYSLNATFQNKDVNVDIFINELTPLVKGFITLGCSSPVLCQEELLQLMKSLERSLWDSCRTPRFAYRKAYFRVFEKCLISSWWLSRTALVVKTYSCPSPGAQGGSSCLFLSFLASQHFPLVLASSRLSQSPQAASCSHYCSICQAGSARFAECSMF